MSSRATSPPRASLGHARGHPSERDRHCRERGTSAVVRGVDWSLAASVRERYARIEQETMMIEKHVEIYRPIFLGTVGTVVQLCKLRGFES